MLQGWQGKINVGCVCVCVAKYMLREESVRMKAKGGEEGTEKSGAVVMAGKENTGEYCSSCTVQNSVGYSSRGES